MSVVGPRCPSGREPSWRRISRSSKAYSGCAPPSPPPASTRNRRSSLRGGQNPLRRRDIAGHRGLQRLQAVELQLRADALDELDRHRPPINVFGEVEQERFEQRRAIVGLGRTPKLATPPSRQPPSRA